MEDIEIYFVVMVGFPYVYRRPKLQMLISNVATLIQYAKSTGLKNFVPVEALIESIRCVIFELCHGYYLELNNHGLPMKVTDTQLSRLQKTFLTCCSIEQEDRVSVSTKVQKLLSTM